jgi:asparagine synthetase B (glutamine-hydrolysing)
MCGIILSEVEIDSNSSNLVKRRGLDSNNFIKFNDFYLFSSVLSIRSVVQQPVLEKSFSLQFNGEIFNDCLSDTEFIKNVIIENADDFIKNALKFEFVTKTYRELNAFECEYSICITVGSFVFFFKDDIGKRSIGYSILPFVISSVNYENEIDPMKLYCYDAKTKTLSSVFKPLEGLVKQYLIRFNSITSYVNSDKYRKELRYLEGYENPQIINQSELLSTSNALILEDHEKYDTLPRFNQSNSEIFKDRIEDNLIIATEFNQSNLPSYDDCVSDVQNLLLDSFKKRTYNGDPVVFLSGGIDSLLVALLVHITIDENRTIFLINTAVPGSFDREMGKLAFTDLKLIFPKRNFIFIEKDLSLELISEHSDRISALMYPKIGKMHFNIASVLYFSAMEASKYSKVVFLGSGADEIFGGYNKYKIDKNDKNDKSQMLFDLFTISSHNISRDDRVISNWNIEGRFPFLDSKIILYTLDLPSNYLIKNDMNKRILRDILKMNKFDRASTVPKKAMQYGTGMTLFENKLNIH